MSQKVQITGKSIIFIVVAFYLFDLLLKFVVINQELIYALFFAFILMSSLKPSVRYLEGLGFHRGIAAFTTFLLTLFSLIFMLAFILPPIVAESIDFIKMLPNLLVNLFPMLEDYLSAESAMKLFPNIPQNFLKLASGIFSNLFFVISVIFFTFYFMLEEELLGNFLKKFLEDGRAMRISKVVQKAEIRMGQWMRGELILMSVIGITTYIGLSFLGIRFALPLAFLAGLLEIVPIIGPIVSAVPAFLVAMTMSPFLGGAVIVLYIIIQQAENNILVPYVMNKAVGIHPITTLIALSIGAKLGGLLGIILAVPFALIVETVLAEILKEET